MRCNRLELKVQEGEEVSFFCKSGKVKEITESASYPGGGRDRRAVEKRGDGIMVGKRGT